MAIFEVFLDFSLSFFPGFAGVFSFNMNTRARRFFFKKLRTFAINSSSPLSSVSPARLLKKDISWANCCCFHLCGFWVPPDLQVHGDRTRDEFNVRRCSRCSGASNATSSISRKQIKTLRKVLRMITKPTITIRRSHVVSSYPPCRRRRRC